MNTGWQLSGTKMSRTTPYHPQGNGLAERANRTLTDMLKTLKASEKSNWPCHLAKVAFAYNVTVNRTTKYSPYLLMFGRAPRLPIDAVFGLDMKQQFTSKNVVKCVQNYPSIFIMLLFYAGPLHYILT